MAIYRPSTFRVLQSGDAVRVTLKDNTTIDCSIRRFLGADNTIIATTPVGEDDPELQTLYYIDDYVQIIYPIPPAQVSDFPDVISVGDTVEIRWTTGAAGAMTGTFVGYDKNTGVVQINDGVNDWFFKDWMYVKVL